MNKVCVKGQRIYFYRPPEPIPKSQVNFSKIEFDMDETWSSFLSVVAQFIQNGEPRNVQVEGGYCFVPSELEVGAFELCLRGDDGESIVASVNRLTLEVCEGFDPSGETPLPPSPDLYTQLIKEIDSGKKVAQSVREDADSGKFNGKRGTDGGWYTPLVTQTDENTLRMAFTPSKDDMPDVAHTDITLPSGVGGTSDHSKLKNRDAADQHPMSAITGLEKVLEGKQPKGDYLTEELDPTVPEWAKQPQKPVYTAQEVGALPATTRIPSTAADVNAEPSGAVSQHNVSDAAHSDIRLLIQGLSERLSAVADSDDATLDQLSEIVAYIKSNKSLIDAITTSKVNVADIVNDLTTSVANKPLSAAQGVALKALIDAITVPDKLPNPNALTFTGAVTGSYDGSEPVSVEIPSGGVSSAEWTLLGEYTMLVSDRSLVIDLSQFEGITHFRIIGNCPKCSEDCGTLYLKLGTKYNQVQSQNKQNTYALRFLGECELFDGQLYGFLGATDGWSTKMPASVVVGTPRDSGKRTNFDMYYSNAVNDTTENTIQIWGY